MCFLEELHCKLYLQFYGTKFDSSDIRNILIFFLRHVTAVTIVKTDISVT